MLPTDSSNSVIGNEHPHYSCAISITGLFSPSHMEYYLESGQAKNPTLAEMTETAIRMLQKEGNGYVLLVEGET